MIFISHDLSVVRQISHRVMVLYLGRVVEFADRETIYKDARHPYTKALISAVPIPDPKLERAKTRLKMSGDLPSPLDTRAQLNFFKSKLIDDADAEQIPAQADRSRARTPGGGTRRGLNRLHPLPSPREGRGSPGMTRFARHFNRFNLEHLRRCRSPAGCTTPAMPRLIVTVFLLLREKCARSVSFLSCCQIWPLSRMMRNLPNG